MYCYIFHNLIVTNFVTKWDALVNMDLLSPQLGDLVYKWVNEPWLLLGKK